MKREANPGKPTISSPLNERERQECHSRFMGGQPAKTRFRRRIFAVHWWIAVADALKINELNSGTQRSRGLKLVHSSSAKKSADSARVQQ